METLTKEITGKLNKELGKNFLPIAEQLRKEGQSDREITKSFYDYLKIESAKFYRECKSSTRIKKTIAANLEELTKIKLTEDSKIEGIYYDKFESNKIPFQFQYPIGPYRADFLIDGWLVFEIDGPLHNKATDKTRDKHMESLGYKVLRVPAWLAVVSSKAVIDEIKAVLKEG